MGRGEPPTGSDRACQNCGCRPLREFVTHGSTLWHCPQCDLYQDGRVAEVEAYDFAYHEDAGYSSRSRKKLRTAAVRLNRIAGLLDADRPRLLDVGCSLGYTVKAAENRGWEGHGVDVHPGVIEMCRQRGLRCEVTRNGALPYPDGFFDAVTAWHVIEHVGDVVRTLVEWSRVLKPGGVLAVETPDAACLKVRWKGAAYDNFWKPEHTYAFNRQNLAALVAQAGLEVVRPPFVGRPPSGDRWMAWYTLGYQCLRAIQEGARIYKAFQLFARKPRDAAAVPLRRSA